MTVKKNEGNTLDRVLLSQLAYEAWLHRAQTAAAVLVGDQSSPVYIQDERAEPLPDGGLLIYVDTSLGRVSLTVPAGHWAWRT